MHCKAIAASFFTPYHRPLWGHCPFQVSSLTIIIDNLNRCKASALKLVTFLNVDFTLYCISNQIEVLIQRLCYNHDNCYVRWSIKLNWTTFLTRYTCADDRFKGILWDRQWSPPSIGIFTHRCWFFYRKAFLTMKLNICLSFRTIQALIASQSLFEK